MKSTYLLIAFLSLMLCACHKADQTDQRMQGVWEYSCSASPGHYIKVSGDSIYGYNTTANPQYEGYIQGSTAYFMSTNLSGTTYLPIPINITSDGRSCSFGSPGDYLTYDTSVCHSSPWWNKIN
jgi:hypothetical protein